jgi:hypothetical protein
VRGLSGPILLLLVAAVVIFRAAPILVTDGVSGFDTQVNGGTGMLYDEWFSAPYDMPAVMTGINYDRTTTYNGVTYKDYIWIDDWGTWSLYVYTPHTIDVNLLPTIGGGNYLWKSVFQGWWGSNWD